MYQRFLKRTQRKEQRTYLAFAAIAVALAVLLGQPTAHSQSYVVVDSENGDRLTGNWRGATDTHFKIEYNGQLLQLPLAGHTLSFVSDLSTVPDRVAAKYFKNGLTLLELGLPERARRNFETAIEEFPRYPDAHYQLGLLYAAAGDTENALERFRSVAILDADGFDLVPRFHEIGDAALANEVYSVAVACYQLILTYYPEHPEVSVLKYLTGFLLVEELQDYDAGLSLLESAVKEHPGMAGQEKARFLIGKLQAETDRLETALQTLEAFVREHPQSEWIYEAHLIRATVNLKLGRLAEAARDAIRISEMSEDVEVQERAKQIIDETKWRVYTDAEGLPDRQAHALATDGTRLWVGTPGGVMLFETANRQWSPIPVVAHLINTALEAVPDVTTLAASPQEVWIGTRSQGALHYNQLTGDIQNYSPKNGFLPARIKDIQMDDTEIWFATETGVIRRIRGSTAPFLYYNTRNSFLLADDIERLLLTPTAVWCISTEGDIFVFDREREGWDSYHSTAIREGMQFVELARAEDQLLFTWFNANEQSNGYFQADMDGGNGKATTLHIGVENENDLRSIYISGVLDTAPIVEEAPEPPAIEENTPDPIDPDFSPESEGFALEPPPIPQIPLVLWIATNHHLYTHRTRSGDVWQDTNTPRIFSGALNVHALAVVADKIWLATSEGLATLKVDVESLESEDL